MNDVRFHANERSPRGRRLAGAVTSSRRPRADRRGASSVETMGVLGAVALGAAVGFSALGATTKEKIVCLGAEILGGGAQCSGPSPTGGSPPLAGAPPAPTQPASAEGDTGEPSVGAAQGAAAPDSFANSGLEGVNKDTFATTFGLNENHACGFPKKLLDRVAPDQYFVALSGETYNPAYCGREVKIKLKGCCASASAIDEGQCTHDAKSSVTSEISATLVDRCPDPKKCMSPSMSKNVRAHLDLAPQEKARAELGQCGNYDMEWSFVDEGSKLPPTAFVVHKPEDQYYFRVGLWLPYGVKKVDVYNGGSWQPAPANGLQAQYTVSVGKSSSELLSSGMTIRVDDFSGKKPMCYKVKKKAGSGDGQFYANSGGEGYYDVQIDPLTRCP